MTDAGGPDHTALAVLGWDDGWRAAAREHAEPGDEPGRVARVDRGRCTVLTAWGSVRAGVHVEAADPLALPTVGDWVLVADREGEPTVVSVLPRRSAFVRGATGAEREVVGGQVVAANVDVVFVVQSLSSGPRLRRLERELVLAWESGSAPVVVLSKADLSDDPEAAVEAVERVALGVPVVVTSTVTGRGLDDLRAFVAHNRTVALIGASGVGKSTLVNALVGEDVQATSAVRETDQRGRHTTVARELVLLPGSGVLVDTPGLRALALWESDEGLSRAFADVEELALGCRFRDCRHDTEPGCAVLAAVEDGRLDAERLASYRKLLAELDYQEAQSDIRARLERSRAERRMGRAIRDAPKKP